MSPARPLQLRAPDPYGEEGAAVLARAFERAASAVGLSRAAQGRMLGVSEASLSRLAHGSRAIDARSKEGELALLFLRAWRSLDALCGGDGEKTRAWMQAENDHLGGKPAELVESVTGLVHVLEYLDAMRGKL
jgi:hypothetical protein